MDMEETKHILAIEDDVHILDLVGETLECGGYEVTRAKNGREGIKQLKTNRFDMVITDLNMPEASGIDVLNFMRASSLNIPVLVVSASWDAFLKNTVEKFKPSAILEKPFAIGQLQGIVKKLLS